MLIEQIYTNCLAQAAYYIESEGEAVIIDPIREVMPYVEKAKTRGAKVKFILETHFHADFVSGHVELAEKTKATIVYGPNAQPKYSAHIAKDGEELKVGKITIKVIHTPGHTLESVCYLLSDENGKPHALFTGDTLFVGDVGRPDLAVADGKISQDDLAGMLFDSLNQKIKPLADDLLVYPAHGPGSQCGKNLGKETFSTLGEQKKNNYALLIDDRAEFIRQVTDGLAPPPKYFFDDARINRDGYEPLNTVLKKNIVSLDIWQILKHMDTGALILDTRDPDVFAKGFVPNSINIGLNGSFAVWVGTVIDINTPLIIVAEPGKETEAITRLARVGYENVLGYFEDGYETWQEAGVLIDEIPNLTPQDFKMMFTGSPEDYIIIDVRKPSEYQSVHIPQARNIPLDSLEDAITSLDKERPYLVHCAGGYRSMIAASLLKKRGVEDVYNVIGGMGSIQKEVPDMVVKETVTA